MKFHWFERDSNARTLENLKQRLAFFENFGYESFLLPIHSRQLDNFTLAAVLAQENKNIKLMVACRPYLISPQYLYMLNMSFNKISAGKLIVNLVHGHIENDENFNGIIDPNNIFQNKDSRRFYMENFLEKYYEIKNKDCNAEILISGGSQKTLDIARKYGGISATNLDHFLRHPEWYYGLNKIFVHIDSVVSKEELSEIVPKIKTFGATDIFLSEKVDISVHNLVKEYSNANL